MAQVMPDGGVWPSRGAEPAAAGCATGADETEREWHFRARIWALLGRFWLEMVRFEGVLEGVFWFT